MANQRLTEEFVRHFRRLKERTGNSPHYIERALDKDPVLAVSIRILAAISRMLDDHRRESPTRFIAQAHPDFHQARKDYDARWSCAEVALWDWEARRAGQETIGEWIHQMLAEAPGSSEDVDVADDRWDFDHDLDSAGGLANLAIEYIDGRADDEPFFSRAAGALAWFEQTVRLNYADIEERFKEFPVIAVPSHVSDHHGLADQRSLYGYLIDLRRSYVAGADLSALTMCRACTERALRGGGGGERRCGDDVVNISRPDPQRLATYC